MIRKLSCAAVLALAVGVALPGAAAAQGALSLQGLGYPPGQLSARSLGTGGALGEMDPTSPLNPASIIEFNGPAMSLQMQPEMRHVTSGSGSASSSAQRFPVFIGSLPLGQRLMMGIASSTLLDRTWSTTTPQSQVIRGDSVQFTSQTNSDGALNDIAFIAAYTVQPWLRVGIAAHAVNGRDVVTIRRTFTDTVSYGNTVEPTTTSYSGNAISAGVEFVDASVGGLSISYRRGGHLEQLAGDTLLATARVPDRFGMGAVFTGLRNASLAASTSYDRWANLGNLGAQTGAAMNTWDTSVGAEFVGPHLATVPLTVRVGGRLRDLPFPANGAQVRELSYSGGIALALAQGHAQLDGTLVRAYRSAPIGVSEAAWILAMGITIRP